MADGTSSVQLIFEALDRAESTLSNLRRNLQGLASEQDRVNSSAGSLTGAQARLQSVLGQTNASVMQTVRSFGQMPGPVGSAAGSLSTLESSIGAVTSASGLMVLGLAAGAAAGVLLAKSAVDSSVALAEHVRNSKVLALQTGLSTDETEKFDASLKNLGLSVDSLKPSFRFLNDNIVKAIQGDAQARAAFQELGISVDDLRRKTSGQIFASALRGLGDIENQAARTQVAIDLMGRGALAVLPLAGDAFEAVADQAERIGLVLSESERKIGESIETSKNQIDRAQEGMKLQAGVLSSILVDPFLKMTAQASQSSAETLHAMTILAVQGKLVLSDLATAAKNTVEAVANSVLKKVGTSAQDVIDWVIQDTLGFNPKDFVSITPGTPEPPPPVMGPFASDSDMDSMASAQKAADAIRDQMKELQALIPLLDRQRAITAITAQQEIDKLEAKKSEALTTEALLMLETKIAQLRRQYFLQPPPEKQAKQFGPELPKDFFKVSAKDLPFPNEMQNVPDMKLPEGLLTETDQFLAKFKDFGNILKVAGDGTTAASQAFIGFIGELKLGQVSALDFGKAMATSVRQELGTFVHEAITGTKSIVQAFGEMIATITEQLIEKAFVSSIISLIPGVGPVVAPIVSGPMHPQTGGTFLRAQIGGSIAQRSGVNLSGTRGFDTVDAKFGYGETILSHGLTDQLSRVLDMVMRPSGQGSGGRPEIHNHNSFTIQPHIHSPFIDRKSFRESMENEMAGIIFDVYERGSYRRDGDS